MNTDELVKMLASGDVAVAPGAGLRRYAIGLGGGLAVAVALMLGVLDGVRPDLVADVTEPMLWVKFIFVTWVALGALLGAARLARPGVELGRAPAALVVALIAMWALAAIAFVRSDPSQQHELVFGATWERCPAYIAMLALPVFVGALWAIRGMAPTRLRLAGAAAGLLAGAVGACVYAFHCAEFAAPFLAVWYVLGMLVLVPIGAWIGPRVLRW